MEKRHRWQSERRVASMAGETRVSIVVSFRYRGAKSSAIESAVTRNAVNCRVSASISIRSLPFSTGTKGGLFSARCSNRNFFALYLPTRCAERLKLNLDAVEATLRGKFRREARIIGKFRLIHSVVAPVERGTSLLFAKYTGNNRAPLKSGPRLYRAFAPRIPT